MNLPKKTKIIATIGPSSQENEIMTQLMQAGVNIFRFNMKHNTVLWHENAILQAKSIANSINYPLGILIDLQGPELRIKTKNDEDISLNLDEEFLISENTAHLQEEGKIVYVPEKEVINTLKVGDSFAIDDGRCLFEVTKKSQDFFLSKALSACVIKTNKSLNTFEKEIVLPCLTDKDLERLDFAAKIDCDYIALSYTRTKKDIKELREQMSKRKINARVIAKIETQAGIDNIDEIIDAADAIMVARGDLGIETPLEKVTYFQKEVIKKCRAKMKSVIVATQMMESMMNSTILSRAEAADVSNAVFDGTDATMLSGETATGNNPVLTAQAMTKILSYNEGLAEISPVDVSCPDVVKGIAQAVLSISRSQDITNIIAVTTTGYTGHLLSALRPKMPIIAVTPTEKVHKSLTLDYGVYPFLTDFPVGDIFSYDKIVNTLKASKLVQNKDKLLITHGQQFGTPGKTNSLVIVEV